jgi:hypothetical protein
VTFRSTLRRSRRSSLPRALRAKGAIRLFRAARYASFIPSYLPIPRSPIFRSFFQVPYPVSPLFATLTKTLGVWGYSSHFGTARVRCCTSSTFRCHELQTFLTSLECAVTEKHRVLPVFGRNRSALSPLQSALPSIRVSVDSKWLTGKLSPLECALTKNGGVGEAAAFSVTFRRSDVETWDVQMRILHPGWRCGTIRSSHCGARALVPQSPKARNFFTIRGNNSAPPGV